MNLTEKDNPIDVFNSWYTEAEKTEINDPTAMSLATCTKEGRPVVRMVLLKGVDERGFVFYTNLGSRKAGELNETPFAALCFHWKTQRRQIRVEGAVERVSDEEADAYFATRSRLSQLGAWASKQSQPMDGKWELEKRVAEYTAKFNVGEVPRPEFWSGFRIVPDSIEFWSDGKFRLHDRFVFAKEGEKWNVTRIFP
ncbi:MAG: pyridoxamine 5'-phosphate oxidase [Alphaproteobacteria bacterium]|nr:pyridoxamine 5'-phosphate oxidase [Rhodospirillales bacterium]MCW9046044.1 pyridoxamine 5'-phosphate oxidase [Alphaproteobacteria bacterium]